MKNLWLIGLGDMGIEYGKVLTKLNKKFIPIGRSKSSSDNFSKIFKIKSEIGGLDNYLKKDRIVPEFAIVSVNVENLYNVAKKLMHIGVKNILLEKPGGLNSVEIKNLFHHSKEKNANLFIAYNRRFFSSVDKAKKIITKDGGLLSFYFDFSEVVDKMNKLDYPIEVKERLVFNNSSHVIDMAFFIGGIPDEIQTFHGFKFDWHKSGAVFNGSGITNKKAYFSYSANWLSPGRWGLRLFTKNHKLILEPLEKLKTQIKGSFNISEVELNDQIDEDFKPGFYKMVKTFLIKDYSSHCSIEYQEKMVDLYYQIANYVEN